ncbi:MAG: hypothetical protein ACK5MQ_18600, partial [Pikeienuella sp.]
DVGQYDIISQVNLLMDKDFGFASPGAPSSAVNAAIIRAEDAPAASPTAAGASFFPESWSVMRVEGDLISSNWIEQHIFATDNDRAEIQLSGSKTNIDLGENILANFTGIGHLGFYYDMIVVGGDFITTNVVQQVNVLLDNDIVTGDVGLADRVEGSDNYLQNSAEITHSGVDTLGEMTAPYREIFDAAANGDALPGSIGSDPLFAGDQALSVLYVTGDLIEQNTVSQINYVGDSDQVELALDDFITTQVALGEDAVRDGTAAQGKKLADGIAGAEERLADGVSELDQSLEDMRETLSEITVTTGSNALLNDVKIKDMGIDSTVMAAGTRYSEALIHQAELIDDAQAAMPTGVAMKGLTNDAIAAFVADSMLAKLQEDDDAPAVPDLFSTAGDLDVMNGVLV